MAWQIQPSDFYTPKAKKYGKNYPNEMRQMLDNVYPETNRQLLHVITVGDKKSQRQDNQDGCDYVGQLGV